MYNCQSVTKNLLWSDRYDLMHLYVHQPLGSTIAKELLRYQSGLDKAEMNQGTI